jgi:Acetyltransferase (GNAT) domain
VIEIGDAPPADEWDAFVRGRADGLLYYTSAYRALVSRLLGCRDRSVVARDGSEIVAALPLFEADGPFGRVVNSSPYYGSHGGVLGDRADAAEALVDAYADVIRDAAAAAVVSNPFSQTAVPFPRTHEDARIAQFTPIALETDRRDRLLASFETRARGSVRKAERSGVTVTRDAGALEWLARTSADNIRALGGIPKEDAFFRLVPELFREGDEYELWTASVDGELVAGALLFYANGVVEYFTPAIAHDARPLQPLSLLVLEAMTDASRRGCSIWNWGGTWKTQESLHRFKRQWNASEREYRYDVTVNEPAVLRARPAELLDGYPGFFVVPFDALAD